jgi:hypothetical protein
MGVFEISVVWDQLRGFRKIARGEEDSGTGGGSESDVRAVGERVPMWYVGIIAFAVSLSFRC